jgi:hypothetical protein
MTADRSKDRHRHKRYSFDLGDDGDLWDEIGQKIGSRERAKLWRKFALAFLKRPGAKIPRLKDYEPPKSD